MVSKWEKILCEENMIKKQGFGGGQKWGPKMIKNGVRRGGVICQKVKKGGLSGAGPGRPFNVKKAGEWFFEKIAILKKCHFATLI